MHAQLNGFCPCGVVAAQTQILGCKIGIADLGRWWNPGHMYNLVLAHWLGVPDSSFTFNRHNSGIHLFIQLLERKPPKTCSTASLASEPHIIVKLISLKAASDRAPEPTTNQVLMVVSWDLITSQVIWPKGKHPKLSAPLRCFSVLVVQCSGSLHTHLEVRS